MAFEVQNTDPGKSFEQSLDIPRNAFRAGDMDAARGFDLPFFYPGYQTLYLSGDDYITLNSGTTIPWDAFTLEFWLKSETGNPSFPAKIIYTDSDTYGPKIWQTSDSNLRAQVINEYMNVPVDLLIWNNFRFVFELADDIWTIKPYINGVFYDGVFDSPVGSGASFSELYIGPDFEGQISDIVVWDFPVSDDPVDAAYIPSSWNEGYGRLPHQSALGIAMHYRLNGQLQSGDNFMKDGIGAYGSDAVVTNSSDYWRDR